MNEWLQFLIAWIVVGFIAGPMVGRMLKGPEDDR